MARTPNPAPNMLYLALEAGEKIEETSEWPMFYEWI